MSDAVSTLCDATGKPSPLLVSIPHTGVLVPPDIAASFASDNIARLPLTDWHLHRLYEFLPGLGIAMLHARYSRFVVDLNRPPDARPLYPGRFETGVVATRTFYGDAVFSEPPSADQVAERVARYHRPYHARLAGLLDQCVARFGRAVLVDAHSVASRASLVHGALTDDVYLGSRQGTSCASWVVDCVADTFRDLGFSVVIDGVYKGGYITAHYGARPDVDAVQIEMCQRLYMDEDDPAGGTSHPAFAVMRGHLQTVIESLQREVSERCT